MSAGEPIRCEGAPRDLGLDQGTACAEAVRDRVRRAGASDWRGRFTPFERGALERAQATARDLRRHFPHLDERVIGLARGAKVPERALHHLLARELRGEGEGAELDVGTDPEGRLSVALPEGGVLRRVEPDAGFVSLEWTLPWLPGALAGVNRAGLAGAVVTRSAEDPGACAAPAFLLLANCLTQFETVDNAAEWCERRPAGGRATLVFADATGGRTAVVVDGEKRFRSEPPGAGEAGGTPLVLDAGLASLRLGGRTLTLGA